MNFTKAHKRAAAKANAAGQPVTIFNDRPEPAPAANAYHYTARPENIPDAAAIITTTYPGRRSRRERKARRR